MFGIKKINYWFWGILLFAILVGAIHYFPQILFQHSLGNEYKGVYVLSSSDENVKVAKVQDIYDGHYFSSNALNAEYKNVSSSEGVNITEFLIAMVGKGLSLTTIQVTLAMKFILPIILFLLLYCLSYLITKSKFGSLITPSLILLGSQLKSPQLLPSIIQDIIHGRLGDFLVYIRPSHPSFSSVFFFACFVFLFLFFKTRKTSYGIWAGIFLGLLFYLYAFFWTFIVVIYGVIILYSLYKKDWHFLKKVLLSLILAIIIGAYYFYTYLFHGFTETTIDAIRFRQTFYYTHRFILDKVVMAAFLLYSGFLFYLRKKDRFRKELVFPYFLLVSSLIIANQQVITGREIQYQHWYWFANLPSMFLAMSVLIIWFLDNLKIKAFVKNIIITIALLFILIFGIGVQYSSYRAIFSDYKYYQNYGYIFDWLNQHTPKDSVVYSDYYLSDFIPVYTHNNIYWSNSSQYNSATPIERAIHNYFVYVKINYNINENQIRDYLQSHKDEVSYMLLSFKVIEEECGGTRTCYPDSVLDFLADKYKIFLQLPLEEQLKKYEVDYLVWDYNKYPSIYLAVDNIAEVVFNHSNIIIYKIER